MPMEPALRTRIKGDAGVMAIARSVEWTERPQVNAAGSAGYPCVVLTLVSDARPPLMQGNQKLRRSRVQIDCMATDANTKRLLREAVIAAIEPPAVVAGTRFERSFIDNVADRSAEAGNVFVHRDQVDAMIWHQEEN